MAWRRSNGASESYSLHDTVHLYVSEVQALLQKSRSVFLLHFGGLVFLILMKSMFSMAFGRFSRISGAQKRSERLAFQKDSTISDCT